MVRREKKERESVGGSDGVEKNAKPFCPGLRVPVGLVAPKQQVGGRHSVTVRTWSDGRRESDASWMSTKQHQAPGEKLSRPTGGRLHVLMRFSGLR